jgi:hypothetical protein
MEKQELKKVDLVPKKHHEIDEKTKALLQIENKAIEFFRLGV